MVGGEENFLPGRFFSGGYLGSSGGAGGGCSLGGRGFGGLGVAEGRQKITEKNKKIIKTIWAFVLLSFNYF